MSRTKIGLRTSDVTVEISGTTFPVTLFANEQVSIDSKSVDEIRTFTKTANYASFNKVILTPDFHKGGGIPIGTVASVNDAIIPQAVGNDIGCGMRFSVLNITEQEFATIDQQQLDRKIRQIFFEGGRNIPTTPAIRRQMLLGGITNNSWNSLTNKFYEYLRHCGHILGDNPNLYETSLYKSQLHEWVIGSAFDEDTTTYDDQLGSIGGGNHFVEVQVVKDIHDKQVAAEWGIKRGNVAVMIHTGSVGIGHMIGSHYMAEAKKLWGTKKSPDNGFYPISVSEQLAHDYINDMKAAVRFAYFNRVALEYMLITGLTDTMKRPVTASFVHDLPHNYADVGDSIIHRKGACPAHINDPVIIPGSMGDASWIMKGMGNDDALCSACHGAGRLFARGAVHKKKSTMSEFKAIRVVTKVDPDSEAFRRRPDLLSEHYKSLSEEAPIMYKPVGPVIDTVVAAAIASKVAMTNPILTIKGV